MARFGFASNFEAHWNPSMEKMDGKVCNMSTFGDRDPWPGHSKVCECFVSDADDEDDDD